MKKQIAVTTVLLLMCVTALAYGPLDDPNGYGAPLDGGLSLLAAAGIGYGAKKMLEKKNKNQA